MSLNVGRCTCCRMVSGWMHNRRQGSPVKDKVLDGGLKASDGQNPIDRFEWYRPRVRSNAAVVPGNRCGWIGPHGRVRMRLASNPWNGYR